MTIPLFFGDTRRSLRIRSRSVPQGRGMDKQANVIVQIFGYIISKEIDFESRTLIYQALRYIDQFSVANKQSRKVFTPNFNEILNLLSPQAASLENSGLYQQVRQQTEKMPVLENLATKVADEINNLVGLNAANLQPAAYEVFHVYS